MQKERTAIFPGSDILYIHGGSRTGGEKEDMEPLCKKLAGKGYITAAMNDSLCSDETFGENGNGCHYVYYPLSGHGLLLDPVSEECYYNALYNFCETCFGY